MKIRRLIAACAVLPALHLLACSVLRGDEIATADGKTQRGTLSGIASASLTWKPETGDELKLSLDNVVRVDLEKTAAPTSATMPLVLLAGGDRVAGSIAGGGERDLRIDSPLFGAVALPIKLVSGILLQRDAPASLASQAADNETDRDTVVLRNGERLIGVVKSIEAEKLTFDCVLGVVPISFERAAAISFAQASPLPAPGGALAVVEFTDGSRISGRTQTADTPDKLALLSAWGQTLSAACRSGVSSVEFRGGRLVYLSDMEPTQVTQVPYLGRVWTYRKDRSVAGGPITLRGKVYRRGLGMHSRTKVAYDLDGQFARFRALVGIDDEVKDLGDAAIRVLCDGKLAGSLDHLRGSQPPTPVDVSVEGVKTLELVVDYGAELDVADHVDWAEARLERK